MTEFHDAALYDRGVATLIASWEGYARGAANAVVQREAGVVCAVFPQEPERSVYNNALLARGLTAAARASALDAMEAMYAAARVARFAAWVHESDRAMGHDLAQRGYSLDSATCAMGMALSGMLLPRPEIAPGSPDWGGYVRRFGLPPDLLHGAELSGFSLVTAQLDGEDVAALLAFDHEGDCGIYNVETLERARRRGLATALTAWQLHDALARGCQTASLQATPMAERMYAAVGFRDLGRFLEYVP